MSVIETRAKVSIIDGATSELKNIASATDRMTASLNKSGKSAKDFSVNMKSFTTSGGTVKSIDAVTGSFNKSADSISNVNKMVNRLIYSVMRYTVIYEGIQKLGDLWGTVVGGAYEYGNMIETNRVGMSGILSSMMQINGQQLSWNQSMQISSKIMQDLQNESLKTSATANELIDTFRALLGPGLGAGMTIEQIEKFTTVGVNGVKSLGLDGTQLIQELRDLLGGGIRPASSTLATALGITDADVKKAKASSEGLYKFLMDRMKGFEYSALETNNTVKGRLDQIKEGLQRGIAEGTEPLREIYSNTLKEFGNSIVQVNTATKEWKINPEFTKSLTSVSNKMIDIGKQAKEVGELLWPAGKAVGGTILAGLDTLSNHVGMIAGLWATIKISKYAKDFMQILTLSREERDLQTSFGRFWQGLNDKVSGYAEKQKQILANQKEQKAWQEKENQLIDNAILTYDKMVSGIVTSANEARTLNGIIQSNENSVTNLAEKWQKMGMSAKEAVATQNKIVWLVNNGYNLEAMNQVRSGNARADEIQQSIAKLKEQQEQQQHAIELYKQQKKAIDDVVAAEHERQMQVKNTAKDELNEIAAIAKKVNMRGDKTSRARFNIDSFLSVDTSNGPVKTKERTIYAWQQDQVTKLRDELHKLKLSEEVVQQTTEKFMDSLKSGMSGKVVPVFEQAINSAKVWQTTINASLERIARMSNEEINYQKFMNSGMLTQNLGKNTSDALKGFATTTLNTAEAEFKKVGMAADEARQKAFEFTNYFIQGLKSIDASNLISVRNLMKQIIESASQYADKFNLVREKVEAVKKANAEAALEFNALSNAFKIGGEEAYQATKRVVEESKRLQAALSERGAVDQANAVYKELINYLNQVAKAKEETALATRDEMQATREATDALKNHAKAVQENNKHKLTMNQRIGKTVGIVSAASLNFSIMSDIVAANSKEDEEWAKKAADVAMQISMVSMGISGLIDLFPSLIKGLKEAVKWFRAFTVAKAVASAAALGVGALVAVGAGSIGYGAYEKYKKYTEGELTLGNTFSDAEMGGFNADSLKDVKVGNKKWTVLPGEADMTEQAQQDKNWAIGNAARQAASTNKLIEQAKLSDLINKGAESSDGKSGTGGSKKELPALEYTDALGNAFWYMQHGYSVYAAAALAGNQMQEAGKSGTESIDYEANNGSGYYGAVQWGGDRFENLKRFSNGDWTSRENQLAFSDYELTQDPYYSTIGSKLKAAGSLEEANHIVFSQYEAPGDDTEGTRLNYAQQLLPRLIALQNKEATLNGETGNGHISDLSRQREEQFKRLIDATNLTIRDTDNLNKMTLSVTGKQSAYDKTMQDANDKLSEYATQIVRDQQLGVGEDTIQRLRKAMDDYADAMKQKAIEARQTEIISRYDDSISAIQNRNLGFGEIDQQREDLTKEYSDLRDYLQEQLQSDSLTYDQRIKLEQKLASTIKSINEQSAYDYKTSWKQAMTEISNTQINWKDTWVSMMSSIESSMADALSSTGNFASRMKSIFKGLAQSVVKSLSQIIAKLLITKMITSLFGGLFGSSNKTNAKVGDAWTGGLNDAINIRSSMIDGFATGGDAQAGKWYMVGERGPEMIRFAKNAHVYKNADTMRMLSSKGQSQQVQIIVNNNTGTPIEAKQSVSQDSTGKMLHQIILTTVGDALTTNEYGLRDAILGAR